MTPQQAREIVSQLELKVIPTDYGDGTFAVHIENLFDSESKAKEFIEALELIVKGV